jgi:hypothetical protein
LKEKTLFGTLEDVALREAWAHEAHAFTPWLSENISRLAEVIGIPLEVQSTEVPVGEFAADILARNPQDDSIVLIENQLEQGDHRHLGQIMTYLAGLGAHTVVWVAPEFREPHLSAIRWLNEHTVDPYAFFAVRARVVRIGPSPLAPLFEVAERPNGWDRRLQEVTRETREITALGAFRKAFWEYMDESYPEAIGYRFGGALGWRSRDLPSGTVLVEYVSKEGVGIFLRARTGGALTFTTEQAKALEVQLGAKLEGGRPGHFFGKSLRVDGMDRSNWKTMADWLRTEAVTYEAAFQCGDAARGH